MSRQAVAIVTVLVASAATAWWYWSTTERGGELRLGGYVEAEQIQVGSRLAGRVESIGVLDGSGDKPVLVDEGVEVESGQVLVTFETDEVRSQLAESRFELERARAKLDELLAGTREQEIRQAEARRDKLAEKVAMLATGPRKQEIEQALQLYELSKAEYATAKQSYVRIVALAERNAASQETLDNSFKVMEVARRAMEADRQKYELLQEGTRPEEIEMARHELAEAAAALDLARAGPRKEEIEQARAAVNAAEARAARLEVLLREGSVRAPVAPAANRTVFVVEAFDLQPGDMVPPGAPLATLVRKDQHWVRAFLRETDLGRLRDNQNVSVSVDSFPDRRFDATVVRVHRVAEFTPRNVQTFEERQDMMFPIKVRVEDPDTLLRPGMAAVVHVPIQRSDAIP